MASRNYGFLYYREPIFTNFYPTRRVPFFHFQNTESISNFKVQDLRIKIKMLRLEQHRSCQRTYGDLVDWKTENEYRIGAARVNWKADSSRRKTRRKEGSTQRPYCRFFKPVAAEAASGKRWVRAMERKWDGSDADRRDFRIVQKHRWRAGRWQNNREPPVAPREQKRYFTVRQISSLNGRA